MDLDETSALEPAAGANAEGGNAAVRRLRVLRLAACAAAWLLAAAAARAHDSWFERLAAPDGERLLALGTGNLFPIYESGIDAQYLASHGCRAAVGDDASAAPAAAAAAASGAASTLQPVRNDDTRLVLRASRGAQTCWAQLTPFDVELAPDKIELYLREAGATPELRATWAAMHGRGLPWRERYTKHARIELAGAAPLPVPMAMDLLLEAAPGAVPRVGDLLTFRLLRDGQPLAGLPLELRSALSPLGIWRRTDAEGRLRIAAPLPGRWLLRGIDLRLSKERPDTWDSRFINLAFEVAPR